MSSNNLDLEQTKGSALNSARNSVKSIEIKKVKKSKGAQSPRIQVFQQHEITFQNFQTRTRFDARNDKKRVSMDKANEDIEVVFDKKQLEKMKTKKFESKFDYLKPDQRRNVAKGTQSGSSRVSNHHKESRSQPKKIQDHQKYKLDIDYLEQYKNTLLQNIGNMEQQDKKKHDNEMLEIKELIEDQSNMIKHAFPDRRSFNQFKYGSVKHKTEKLAPLAHGPYIRTALQETILNANQEQFNKRKLLSPDNSSSVTCTLISPENKRKMIQNKTKSMFYNTQVTSPKNQTDRYENIKNADSGAQILGDYKIIKDGHTQKNLVIVTNNSSSPRKNQTNPVSPSPKITLDYGETELLVDSDNEDNEVVLPMSSEQKFTKYQGFFSIRQQKQQKAPAKKNQYDFPSIGSPQDQLRPKKLYDFPSICSVMSPSNQVIEEQTAETPVRFRKMTYLTKMTPQVSRLDVNQDQKHTYCQSQLSYVNGNFSGRDSMIQKRNRNNQPTQISSDLSTSNSNDERTLPFMVKH